MNDRSCFSAASLRVSVNGAEIRNRHAACTAAEEVAMTSLRPSGDVIEVAAGGACLPTVNCSPFASFDESALTGESIPVERDGR